MNKLNYSVTLESPALTGQSGIIGKNIDIVTIRDEDNLPYFKASHIKGILKDKVEQFSKTLNGNIETEKHEVFFGKAGGNNTGRLRFSDLKFDSITGISCKEINSKEYENIKDAICYDDRHGIKIDRHTLTTEDGSLFNYEFINKKTIFSGSIDFTLKNDSEKEYITLILASLFHLEAIGGQKSRGIGRISVSINNKNITQLESIVSNLNVEKPGTLNLTDSQLVTKEYTLKFDENIVLKQKEIGNEISTLNYLQGSSIKGAVIQYFIDNYSLSDEEIQYNFIDDLKITQALPDGKVFTPASYYRCKYSDKCGNDEIVDKIYNDDKECKCKNKLERIPAGYMDLNDKKSFSFNKKSDVGIAIDYNTRTSADGQIFNREILRVTDNKKKSIFKGKITIPKGLADLINNKELYIGKYKSKGLGKCTILLNDYLDKKVDLKTRIEKQMKENGAFFTVDCRSDIVLPFLSLNNHKEQLKSLFKLDTLELEETKSFINYDKLGGYNSINNTRKQDEIIICRGSVLAFKMTGNKNEIVQSLIEIESIGIGLRKLEGFGEIEIASELHLKEVLNAK